MSTGPKQCGLNWRRYWRFSAGMCARIGGDDRLSFSDFWSFGADDQGRSVAVLSAPGGNLERLKDIFESDECSIFIERPGVVWKRLIC